MLAASHEAEGAGTNHPPALRMAVIAFPTNNITMIALVLALSARPRRPALAAA